MKINQYERALQLVMLMLRGIPNPTPEIVPQKVKLVLDMLKAEGNLEKVDEDRLIRDIESRCEVWKEKATVLEDKNNHEIWLPYYKTQIKWKFWKRYERYLMEEKGLSEQNVMRIDELTDDVLERLEYPLREGSWDRRGMVVGQVQSGKTSHYTGLICKAADAGYKLIIILAGMHESLRSQTQSRIDEGFLGFDTRLNRSFARENRRIGVGTLRGEEFISVHSLTSSEDKGDFNRRVASQVGVIPGGNDPVVLVVKKNKSVLTNLTNWAISFHGRIDSRTGKKVVREIPLLVIDDEADNASVNTNPIPYDENGKPLEDYDVTAINGKIRKLLTHFEKSAYVGYTATPFANIFIYPDSETSTHGEDLFPRDFIVNLPVPPNYIGPTQIFGFSPESKPESDKNDGLPIIRYISDHGSFLPDDHKKYHIPENIPSSLKTAIKSFIISCAARMARGEQNNHNSMLIHVTRYTVVQGKVEQLVSEELNFLRRQMEYEAQDVPVGIYKDFETLWYFSESYSHPDYLRTTKLVKEQINDPLITEISWEDVKNFLFEAVSRIRVKQINGTAKDALDYNDHPKGLSVIAIGGDKLSRGLTLEGLTVSYYLRASRMYDTLMQMGRWFGFRPGYVDLCRLYTSGDLVKWYKFITFASEELRSEFDYMAASNSTPSEYGLRVRTHPDGLLITAVNKMRSGTVMNISYANSIVETIVFSKQKKIIENNFKVVEQFLCDLGPKSQIKDNKILWENIPPQKIIQLLTEYLVHEDSKKAAPSPLRNYIEEQMNNRELKSWTVALIDKKSAKHHYPFEGLDNEIGLSQRKNMEEPSGARYSLSKNRMIDPKDEYIDLTQEEIDEALRRMKNDPNRKSRSSKEPMAPSGPYIREVRSPEKGLLIIYPLDPECAGIKTEMPIIGLAFSIPDSNKAVKVQYTVNNKYWEQEFDRAS